MATEFATSQNLTGGNIQIVLDNLLYRALEPIVFHTNIFDTQIVHVLSRITTNKKRKLVSIERERAISLLAKALTETNHKIKFSLIEQAKIERSIIHRFINNVLTELNVFDSLYKSNLLKKSIYIENKMQVIASSLGASDYENLYCVRAQVTEFIDSYFSYRNSIVDHYIKFSHKMSNNFRGSKLNNYDRNDVLQNFLSAVTKAIDKYDSSKGALTSYINYWILNAQTCNSNSSEYGIAYTLPHGKKRGKINDKSNVNFSLSLDSEELLNIEHIDNVHGDIEDKEENIIIQYLTKAVDKKGCLRLTLDIEEFFSEKEERQMRECMARQKFRCNTK